MSMREYAVDDYGLVLDRETIKTILIKVNEDYAKNPPDDWVYEFYNQGFCEWISEFTGEAFEILNDGSSAWHTEGNYVYSYDAIVYIQASHYPTLFNPAYNNMDELVDEFRSKIGEYLPEDFDYRSRIRHICGTYYG